MQPPPTSPLFPYTTLFRSGRSTVMGGEIQKVDLVRDQLALKVAGGHSINILFDERTQVYHDGKKMSVLNLRPEEDRKSTRLNSSHANTSYAVFCLKKTRTT